MFGLHSYKIMHYNYVFLKLFGSIPETPVKTEFFEYRFYVAEQITLILMKDVVTKQMLPTYNIKLQMVTVLGARNIGYTMPCCVSLLQCHHFYYPCMLFTIWTWVLVQCCVYGWFLITVVINTSNIKTISSPAKEERYTISVVSTRQRHSWALGYCWLVRW